MAKGTLKISSADAFTAADLAPNSVDSSELVDGSVDLSHMSVNSIDSDQYVDGSIDLAHMSVNSVDSDQYVDGSIDNAHLADDAVGTDELANDVVINTSGAITTTGLATVAKIVETGGVLKENLLTNSGFDVWSNGTTEGITTLLSDDMADDDTGDWTSTYTDTFTFNTDRYRFGRNSADARASIVVSGMVVGRLYRISADFKNGSATSKEAWVNIDGNPGTYPLKGSSIVTSSSFQTASFIWVAVGTSETCWLWCTASSSNYLEVQNFIVEEVTPGCVAANTLAFDGWAKAASADLYRENWDQVAGHFGGSYNVQSGSKYSLKLVGGTDGTWDVFYNGGNLPEKLRYAGRTITFGAWVKTDAANQIQLQIYDDGANLSSNNTGTGWEWLEITKTIDADTGQTSVGFLVDNTKTAYISQPMLVFGNSIGEGNYNRPRGEIINCQTQIPIAPIAVTSPYDTLSSNRTYGLEAYSKGLLPKGVKALGMRGYKTPAAAGNYFGINAGTAGWQYLTYSPTSSVETFHVRITMLNGAEHIAIQRNATFTGVAMGVNWVELVD